MSSEFSPRDCRFGDDCRYEHDIRKYLREGKRPDLTTFGARCPVWEARGICNAGWKCRFIGSHMEEKESANGKKELVLTEDEVCKARARPTVDGEDVANGVSLEQKMKLSRRKVQTPKADVYLKWLDRNMGETIKSGEDNQNPTSNGDAKKALVRMPHRPLWRSKMWKRIGPRTSNHHYFRAKSDVYTLDRRRLFSHH